MHPKYSVDNTANRTPIDTTNTQISLQTATDDAAYGFQSNSAEHTDIIRDL